MSEFKITGFNCTYILLISAVLWVFLSVSPGVEIQSSIIPVSYALTWRSGAQYSGAILSFGRLIHFN